MTISPKNVFFRHFTMKPNLFWVSKIKSLRGDGTGTTNLQTWLVKIIILASSIIIIIMFCSSLNLVKLGWLTDERKQVSFYTKWLSLFAPERWKHWCLIFLFRTGSLMQRMRRRREAGGHSSVRSARAARWKRNAQTQDHINVALGLHISALEQGPVAKMKYLLDTSRNIPQELISKKLENRTNK